MVRAIADRIADQPTLIHIPAHNRMASLRVYVVARIIRQGALADIAGTNSDAQTRYEAMLHIRDREVICGGGPARQ